MLRHHERVTARAPVMNDRRQSRVRAKRRMERDFDAAFEIGAREVRLSLRNQTRLHFKDRRIDAAVNGRRSCGRE